MSVLIKLYSFWMTTIVVRTVGLVIVRPNVASAATTGLLPVSVQQVCRSSSAWYLSIRPNALDNDWMAKKRKQVSQNQLSTYEAMTTMRTRVHNGLQIKMEKIKQEEDKIGSTASNDMITLAKQRNKQTYVYIYI